MLRRLSALCCVVLAFAPLAHAGEFEWMMREFSRQTGLQQLHIPFLGLARFTVAVAHPAGTSSFKLAIFEHPRLAAPDFAAFTASAVGPAWKPFIRVRERSGEITNCYLQNEGKNLKVLVAVLDSSEATFVEVHLKPDALATFIKEHNHHSQD